MTAFRKYTASVVVVLLVISVTLVYVAKSNIEEFRDEQIKLAGFAARNTEALLHLYVAELHRSIELFFNDNHQEFLALLNKDTRFRARATLQQKLHRQLADAVVFTLADATGQPLLNDDESVIGDVCRENMRLFASDPVGIAAQLRMHSDKLDGHFDVLSLAPISNEEEAILLVAFKAHRIALYLNLLQPPGHSLFLAKTGSKGQIEIAASGPPQRYRLKHELTAAETSRIMFSEHVDATAWDVIDVIDFEMLQREKWRIIRQSILLFAAFLCGGVFFLVVIRCQKDMKRGVLNELEPYRRQLEEQIRNRTAALEAANERLQHLSLSDGLTGIANRRHFDHVLARELRRALRESAPLSLLLIDIDYFKKYNDAVGHLAGDDALKKIAHAIQNEFQRGADLAARYGGEEFAVILPNATAREAFKQAERVRQIVDKLNIKHPDSDITDHVTISVGVSSLDTDQYKTTDELIDEADTALYRSKSEGRNQSNTFQP
jgi:diguanylate cyclase (GGDEF)-like protein